MVAPRLIATDLDGTFLTTAKTVSPLNLAAAERAAQLGVPLVVATGRPVRPAKSGGFCTSKQCHHHERNRYIDDDVLK